LLVNFALSYKNNFEHVFTDFRDSKPCTGGNTTFKKPLIVDM